MSFEIEKAYRYCESVTKLHAKSFYFAAKFLPRGKQRAVYPIYAFCRHVDDEIDELGAGSEADAVEAVQKWRSKLKEIYEGNGGETEPPARDARQTAVLTAWRDLLKTYRIPPDLPLDLVQGVLMDATVKRYETFDELYVYCYRVASTVGLMSSEILGYSDRIALEYAEAMGIGMQLTNILRDVGEDAAMGRIYLPQEDLRAFGVTEEQISANEFDENFARLMKFQIERARAFYEKGEKGIAYLEKDSRFTVLLASRIYAKIITQIEKQNYNVFTRRAHTSKMQKLLAIPRIWLQTPK
ncbi:MAG TPA: phytoene/squalene synthase family protein [Pyrinomonadaceae bacterium]|jgi:phytoene synthase